MYTKHLTPSLPLLLMCLPALVLFLLFNYLPMGGLILAFKDFNYADGIFGSAWSGIKNFKFLFSSNDAWTITRNTLGMNCIFIFVGLICALTMAILLNEINKKRYIKIYQTVMFFPYFFSWVVVAYMFYSFLSPQYGIIDSILKNLGLGTIDWYTHPCYWPFILTFASVWKSLGYGAVIYYAGIMGIDTEYYEVAAMDGATRFQMNYKITIPLLAPIITMLTLLQIGRIFYADFGLFYFVPMHIGLLYPTTLVIDTYVFNGLRVTGDISMSTAAGFYQSIVGFIMILGANFVVRRINKENAIF